ncbi:TRAP transporter small permease [Aliifodinibius sp. S!AR15-10]|uniref:TRAP transporter small permease n=1 Tax=Aliifodinibius sp. S!AR15-10 TaxID=2950437 RepID=UPI002856E864|nr:TRAP transporter small permease [Aliifodinibius sp. S!AR15-10]MDR8390634.1 TRAP transporter small permease [Aliifodinibius sp. S!AR15-10]
MNGTVKKAIDKTLDWTLILILGSMSLLVAINVFFRFVLNSSIYWGDEVALVLMVWLTFLGAAVSTRENEHYEFKYLVHKLSGRSLKVYLFSRHIINIIAILILGYYSGLVAIQIHSWILPATEISRSFVYGACPLGCVFMLIYSVEQFISDIKRSR